MKAFCVVAVLAITAQALWIDEPVNHDELIASVNDAKSSWVAGYNDYFDGWTFSEAMKLMGVKKDPNAKPLPTQSFTQAELDATPASFDPRNNSCIGPVLDQGECGSCWAFGAAEAISDRTCLQGGGSFVQLAALDLVTCDNNDAGCQGGDPGSAWTYAQTSGLVTESCYPYLTSEGGPIPTCPPSQEPCLNFVNTPSCTKDCKNGVTGVAAIAAEITKNGPVEAAFTVYQDFVTYKSGVYVHTSGQVLGGHAVKMIGYGTTSSGEDYWLVQNSWTTTWGDNGYFMIKKGVNECGIESDVVAGMVN